MNISSAEQLRIELNKSLAEISSPREKVFVVARYFNSILSLKSQNLIDAYIPEHIELFISNLKKYDCFGIAPENTSNLLQTVDSLFAISLPADFSEQLKHLKFLIIQKLELLNNSLDAIESSESKTGAITFPVLEKEFGTGQLRNGLLESISVHLKRTKGERKFILVPSGEELEERLQKQLVDSWQSAVDRAQGYLNKKIENFEVIIEFDKKFGLIEGNSFGTALTVSLLKEILFYYNSKISITPTSSISFTGGMGERGIITNSSEDIITQKTEIVFYSDVNLFVVPKNDEELANGRLNELKKEFPKRDLIIVGIEDLSDLLNRRNIVEIKKQPVVKRTGNLIKKNWVAISAILFLTAIISIFIISDIDTNPVSFTADGDKIYIKNKSGKVLWSNNRNVPENMVNSSNFLRNVVKIVDIDSDGTNEVIFSGIKANDKFSTIICYSSEGEAIWEYSFQDTVYSVREKLPPIYGAFLIDTLTFNGIKSLFAVAGNSPSFSSAVFRLDIKTGRRLSGTFWCSGHTYSGLLKDINNDGKMDILCVGLDNGFEDAVFFGFDIDTTTQVRPTITTYLINGFPVADLITYIRFPKTDYDFLKNYRTPGIQADGLIDYQNSEYYQFIVDSDLDEYASTLWYQIDYNLKDVNVIVDGRFRVMRDSLVAYGKLQPPYTDTPEYVELIKSKILYYKNGEWIKQEEF